jgi:uncharacterized protein (DUF302 family)
VGWGPDQGIPVKAGDRVIDDHDAVGRLGPMRIQTAQEAEKRYRVALALAEVLRRTTISLNPVTSALDNKLEILSAEQLR